MYTYLSKAGTILQQQIEQEWIRMMNQLKDAIHIDNPKWKLNDMSQQEKVQEQIKIGYLINKGYLVL